MFLPKFVNINASWPVREVFSNNKESKAHLSKVSNAIACENTSNPMESNANVNSQNRCIKFGDCNICSADEFSSNRNELLIAAHNLVLESGNNNFEQCRIAINDKLNFEFMRHMLADYSDKLVCDLLQYGFPLGCVRELSALDTPKRNMNHKGAREFPLELNKYFVKEIKSKTVLGPFKFNPFDIPMLISPLNSVPKKDTTERRIILDLSYPKNKALNDTINKDEYLGEKVHLTYPKIDDLVKLVQEKGRGCFMYKRDLKKAYRQIYIDPGDYHKVGYRFQKHIMFDIVLSMGLRSAAHICQRVTNAITFIMHVVGICICNYLDDLMGVEKPQLAQFAFDTLGGILARCGFEESKDKACLPATKMVFLGILFDSEKMTLEITPERLLEIMELIQDWLTKSHATKKQLQSLLGKLNFVSSCVRPGRIFVQRLLKFLRKIYTSSAHLHSLPDYIKRDLCWWKTFLPVYNGISMMAVNEWSEPDNMLATDACLSGCGGVFGGQYFHAEFPEIIKNKHLHINELEMLTIVVALKIWGVQLRGHRITIFCDNQSSCAIINKGSSRSDFMQSCLREICFLAASHEFELRAKHISGVNNRLADHLSRWEQDSCHRLAIEQELGPSHICQQISEDLFQLSECW